MYPIILHHERYGPRSYGLAGYRIPYIAFRFHIQHLFFNMFRQHELLDF